MLSCYVHIFYFFFVFKQKTAYEMRISDWSSDLCSSDLPERRDVDRIPQSEPEAVHIGPLRRDHAAEQVARLFRRVADERPDRVVGNQLEAVGEEIGRAAGRERG